jgi:AcrR family transcriptional regulator
MATTASGLRERKKERTRHELMAVAAQLFNERGFDHVTIEEIAAAAEVSPRTFYRYFPAKEDLVLGNVDESARTLIDALRARPDGEPILDSIRGLVRDLATDFEADIDTQRSRAAVLESTPSLKLRNAERQGILEEALAPVIAERLGSSVATDLKPRLIAACAVAAIRVASATWIAGGAHGSLLPIVDEALAMLTQGFDA